MFERCGLDESGRGTNCDASRIDRPRTNECYLMLDVQYSGELCIVRLDSPPMNTITLEMLDAIVSAIHSADNNPAVSGTMLTGGPRQFSAGADIHLFERLQSSKDAINLSRTFQDAFHWIEDSAKPVIAALSGSVVGGALELAMACSARIAVQGTRLGLPEVKLGLIPGAGGTQRLPRLVGPRRALRMMLTGELIDAETARADGLVDAICSEDQISEQCHELLVMLATAQRTCDRTDKYPEAELTMALAEAEKIAAAIRPEIIAPRKIIEAVRIGLRESFTAGLRCEQQSFAECMQTRATRNRIHLFFATRNVAKLPELAKAAPGEVKRTAVVGMGTMGTGIAQALLAGGFQVKVLDEQQDAVARGVARIRSSLDRRVTDGKMSPAQRDRLIENLVPVSQFEDLSGTDLVIESVFEDVSVKQGVLRRLEQCCGDKTILATNTSTISLDLLAEPLRRGERLIGMHFFNPAQSMPLLEVIRRPDTPVEVLATAMQAGRAMRKTPVVVFNRAGFLVSRLFVPYVQEAFQLIEEGCSPRSIDKAALEFGFPMGPLVLIDMAGLDILVHTQRILQQAFPHHGDLSRIATRLVELGHRGQKTGGGVYRYDPASRDALDSPLTAELIGEIRGSAAPSQSSEDGGQIAERLVLRMVSEAFLALEEGVARSAGDVDVATVMGVGFPDFRGGVCQYARDLGLNHVRDRLEKFTQQFGPRYKPCGLIKTNSGE